jgi:DNA-binding response OmpR family regulator
VPSRTLALIDDDPLFTPFLADALRERGLAVTVFSDGDEFLTDAAAFEFDFYLVDLMLPGIDGLNLVRLIRRKGWAGIIVVSGRDDDAVFEDVLRAGADMYLGKPVRTEQVMLAINAVARRIDHARAQVDVWRLDLPAGCGAVLRLSFDAARIDLDLELLDGAGMPISATSSLGSRAKRSWPTKTLGRSKTRRATRFRPKVQVRDARRARGQ